VIVPTSDAAGSSVMRSVRSRELGDSREMVPVFFKDYCRFRYGESRGNGDVLTVIVWPEPLIADRSLQSDVGAVERVSSNWGCVSDGIYHVMGR
jgi:hypothetical protein